MSLSGRYKEPIAKISKIFGTKGEVAMRLYDVFPDNPNLEEPLFIDIDGLEVPLFFHAFVRKGNNKAIARFDDIDNEYRAQELIGKELYIYVQDEEDGELYYEDMAGFSLTDIRSGKKGIITEYIDYQDNPLFKVLFGEIEVLVPVADDIIEEIDEEQRSVKASLPDGLLELYFEKPL
ncbi:MAG TPA: 16S rRNA processing protein RimM [Candidatus Avirikenella pullistercoris]|nr:16S rRNA processing protein RimM [Candidatus Avirikenella pullistercoris]